MKGVDDILPQAFGVNVLLILSARAVVIARMVALRRAGFPTNFLMKRRLMPSIRDTTLDGAEVCPQELVKAKYALGSHKLPLQYR